MPLGTQERVPIRACWGGQKPSLPSPAYPSAGQRAVPGVGRAVTGGWGGSAPGFGAFPPGS